MKVAGNGQGKILTPEELRRLFTEGLRSPRDRALFGICLFTACRVSEALALQTSDIKGETLTFRKSTTKGKLKTRVVDIQPGLAALLAEYQPSPGALFPGMRGISPTLTRFMADKILRDACLRIGLVGVSTHSFRRRTSLTIMSSAGIPLRVIQEISGHNDLGTLQRYLEVSPEQKRHAVAALGF
ncbi:site-specific integrase [Chroococcidiopsis sp. CCMEE 29]|uniref:tyrosine-type recombinase/integrase n=1 Tax=Chroococcidiopsis sp. CCMEE 29 TaxID=155894 RepID=UPI0020225E15|nr:site-specific integrase [Chroococcidiopsis sp. CCMEE 29]